MISLSNSILTLFTTLLLWVAVIAQEGRDKPFPKWARDRIFSISIKAPMAAYFNRKENRNEKNLLLILTKHFREREEDMYFLHRADQPGKVGEYTLCNMFQETSLEAVAAKTETLGFGNFTSTCITEIASPNKYYADVKANKELFDTLISYGDAVQKAGLAANRATGSEFKKVFSHSHFGYNDTVQSCEVAHAAGFRIGGKWGIMSSVTEFAINLNKKDFGRRYLVEYLHVAPNLNLPISNLLFSVPQWNGTREGSMKSRTIMNTTTSIEVWRGVPAASIFRQVMTLDENRAVHAALEKGKQWTEQALDSTTKSNIAIMILSATLTLIPLALFADVSLLTTFSYAVVTDLVSCMPLFIKGMELIAHSKKEQTAVLSWVYGMETKTDIGIVETWCAKCHPRNDIYVMGVVFIGLSLAAILIGSALEIITRIRLKRRKRRYEFLQSQIKNKSEDQLWSKYDRCFECGCDIGRSNIRISNGKGRRQREIADRRSLVWPR